MNFKVGDVVEALEECIDVTPGRQYVVTRTSGNKIHFIDDVDETTGLPGDKFKLVLRPGGEPEKPASILDEAAKIAGVDRSEAYGHPLDNHRRIAALWQAYLDARKPGALTPQDVARMMILLKVARDIHAPKRDNLVDIAGYARCLEMMEDKA